MTRKDAVLVAEDEEQARRSLTSLLEDEGYEVLAAADGLEALRVLSTRPVEAALLDVRMPGADGLTLLRRVQELPRPPAVLIMTAYGTSAIAIEAIKLGAFDYITKPINVEELLVQLDRSIKNRRQAEELNMYAAGDISAAPATLAGSSARMQTVYKLIGQVAPTNSTVLIHGESGTGKELVARAIHEHSLRNMQRLVKVNCAAIPESLLESELFGYERGAFTGAAQRRIGKLEFADRGTVFLDEIGELSTATQAKLLRVLQERSVERLGSNQTIPLDIRIVAATNRDLEAAVRDGQFRQDLYYRLNVVSIYVPPLRERREDIPELAAALLRRCASRLDLKEPALSSEACALLTRQDWPGNVRELEHCLERALVLARGGPVLPQHVQLPERATHALRDVPIEMGFHASVRQLERQLIERALAEAGGNRSRAAELLQINRRLLYDKMREFGLS